MKLAEANMKARANLNYEKGVWRNRQTNKAVGTSKLEDSAISPMSSNISKKRMKAGGYG